LRSEPGSLAVGGAHQNPVLLEWNNLDLVAAAREILPCCGSRRWAEALASARPFDQVEDLLTKSDELWLALDTKDWHEAFSSHPRIGEKKAPSSATARSAQWSGQEQRGVSYASDQIQERLQRGNAAYEQRFGRTCIICATGKSAEEMLAILERRLDNDEGLELREAAEQQRQIIQIRLRKWLQL
jgi:2-oxo-4-hydroxy-4-carboxy-5-ureidoimidazoline decarboxylase